MNYLQNTQWTSKLLIKPGCSAIFKRLRAFGHNTRAYNIKARIKEQGIPFFIFYRALNQICILSLTAAFHVNAFSMTYVVGTVQYLGLSRYAPIEFESEGMIHGGGLATIAVEYALANVVITLLSPVKVPFFVALWPHARRKFPFLDKLNFPSNLRGRIQQQTERSS